MNYAELDPGIRDVVSLLREHGFETTDSGDGVSKPAEWYASGEAMPFPNVAAKVARESFFGEAARMQEVLGPKWRIEATYWPSSDVYMLLAVGQ